MTDHKLDPRQVAEEAERILASPVFKGAIQQLRDESLEVLLNASGEDADAKRREMAFLINTVNGIEKRIRTTMLLAQRELKPRIVGA